MLLGLYGPKWLTRSWTSSEVLVVIGVTDIIPDSCYYRAMDPEITLGSDLGPDVPMNPGSSIGYLYQYVPTPTVTWPSDTSVVSGG